jgi:hypothetical protein
MKTRQRDDEFPDLTGEMAEALIALGDKTVVNYLERNPAEATRIAKLARSKQADAIFALDERLKGSAEKPVKVGGEPMADYGKRRTEEMTKGRRRAEGMAAGFGRA